MLIILALVAWSATSAASVMPEKIMDSTYNFATYNTSGMEPSHFADKSERTIDIPVMLEELEQQFRDLSSNEKDALMKNLKWGYDNVIKQTQMFQTQSYKYWQKRLAELCKNSDVADEILFKLLDHHFNDDYEFTKYLLSEMDTTGISERLLKLQVKKWNTKLNLDETEVYDRLKLNEVEGNPLKNSYFLQWVSFFVAKYPTTDLTKMFNFLADKISAEKLIAYLIEKSTIEMGDWKSKDVVLDLVRIAMKYKRVTDLSNEHAFLLFKLDKAKYNPIEDPFFYKWFTFLKKQSSNGSYNEEMFVIMKKYFEGADIIQYLVMEAKSDNNIVKHVALTLLDLQLSEWKTENLSNEAVYIKLQLNDPNISPLDNNVFPSWNRFL